MCGAAAHIRAQGAWRGCESVRIRFDVHVSPLHQRIAFVGKHHGPDATRGRHDCGHLLGGEHRTGRIAWRVHPYGLDARHILPGFHIGHVIDLEHLGTGQLGADLISRVGDLRLHHHVTRTQVQQGGHQRHPLLGADGRHHVRINRRQIDIARRREPFGDGGTQIGGAGGDRVSVGVWIV